MSHIKKRLVFIVEDNEMYSLMLDYKLSNSSIVQCVSFKTGEECIQNLALEPILIILDYWLPGIDGKETFEQIKKISPQIPVIFLTRNEDEEVGKELLKMGVYDYIFKGDDPIQHLKAIINFFLDKVIVSEKKEIMQRNVVAFILFFIALSVVFIYIYQ